VWREKTNVFATNLQKKLFCRKLTLLREKNIFLPVTLLRERNFFCRFWTFVDFLFEKVENNRISGQKIWKTAHYLGPL